MKKTFTICFSLVALFFASCAHTTYPQPALEKETSVVHNVNNIFN